MPKILPPVRGHNSKHTSLEKLHTLYANYRAEDFFAGMDALLESSSSFETPLSESLLFRYVSDCFEGGVRVVYELSNLVQRGSHLAEITKQAITPPGNLLSHEKINYLVDLGGSYERALRFLTRIGAPRTVVDRVIRVLGLQEIFRTFESIDLSQASGTFNLPESHSQGEGFIFDKTLFGWRRSHPDLKIAAELSIATLPGAISFGQSSLVLHGDQAFMPFSHFKLANENVVRNDSLFISLGAGYLVSRAPPTCSNRIPGPSVSLTSADSYHFGHFVTENLPRLRAFVSDGVNLKDATVVIDSVAERYSPIIRSWNKKPRLRTVGATEGTIHEELMVARATSFAPSDLTHGSPFVNEESRPTMFELPWELGKPTIHESKKVLVGRLGLLREGTGEASRRRLLNNKVAMEILTRLQFRVVERSELSFDKLEPMLRNAKYIVTEAGSSIALNLLLVELVGKSVLLIQHPQANRQNQRMAGRLAARGARVFIVKGKAVGSSIRADYTVNAHSFRRAIREMLH